MRSALRLWTAALALAALASASAHAAQTFVWNYRLGQTPGEANNLGGAIESITAAYEPGGHGFYYSVTFSNQITEGFTLMLSPGATPKEHSAELAVLYFDATDRQNLRLSAYAFNGVNMETSFFDGAQFAGVQTPDRIQSTAGSLARLDASMSVVDQGGKRTMTINFFADEINLHTPLTPPPNAPGDSEWTGLAFGQQLGMWFHPFSTLDTSYDQNGYLTDWTGTRGWLDGTGWETFIVPAPSAAGVLMGVGVLTLRRRRPH